MGRACRIGGLLAAICLATPAGAQTISGLARVNDDASITIRQHRIHLWGITIPQTGEDCRGFERPLRCAPRAALALDFKIQGFVHCEPRATRRDGAVEAVCHAQRTSFEPGVDLAAYLLNHGWAVAAPAAPAEYQALERIARETGRGLWGVPGLVRP